MEGEIKKTPQAPGLLPGPRKTPTGRGTQKNKKEAKETPFGN